MIESPSFVTIVLAGRGVAHSAHSQLEALRLISWETLGVQGPIRVGSFPGTSLSLELGEEGAGAAPMSGTPWAWSAP